MMNNSANNFQSPPSTPSRRAETVAIVGVILFFFVATLSLLLSRLSTGSPLLSALALQVGAGCGFFALAFLHLRLMRAAAEENNLRRDAERARAAQGLTSIFTPDDEPPAARALRQVEKYLIPLFSLLLAAILLLPAAFVFWWSEMPFNPQPITPMFGVLPIIAGAALFIFGTYAVGLANSTTDAERLRAGAGYAKLSAAKTALMGAALLLSDKIGFYPARILMWIIVGGATLIAFEIILHLIFSPYRPRSAQDENRPAYDARFAGIFAQPVGVLNTLAQALDYQFGFRVSDTWFFRFVEKSLLPLLLILCLTFHALSCFVVVAPGQAAVIERWGKPRGMTNNGESDWDKFAAANPPLKSGVYLKYPYPFEMVQFVDLERPTTLIFGFDPHTATTTTADWDVEHYTDERRYLMPRAPANDATNASANNLDVMLIAGEFIVEYRIGDAADVYRYLYNYRNSPQMLAALSERELTATLASADFWRVLTAHGESQIQAQLNARLTAAARRENLGLIVSGLTIANLHPPAGAIGAAFLAVAQSGQKKETEIYRGRIEALKILGLAPAEATTILDEAAAYKNAQQKLAAANREWFAAQRRAENVAPQIFRVNKQMHTLETALSKVQKILLPTNTTLIMDDSKTADPDSVTNIMAREIQKLNAK